MSFPAAGRASTSVPAATGGPVLRSPWPASPSPVRPGPAAAAPPKPRAPMEPEGGQNRYPREGATAERHAAPAVAMALSPAPEPTPLRTSSGAQPQSRLGEGSVRWARNALSPGAPLYTRHTTPKADCKEGSHPADVSRSVRVVSG